MNLLCDKFNCKNDHLNIFDFSSWNNEKTFYLVLEQSISVIKLT